LDKGIDFSSLPKKSGKQQKQPEQLRKAKARSKASSKASRRNQNEISPPQKLPKQRWFLCSRLIFLLKRISLHAVKTGKSGCCKIIYIPVYLNVDDKIYNKEEG
jgi:hypothetical protein